MSKWKFQWYKPRTVAFTKCRLRDEPKGRCWSGMPPSESMQVSALPPVWIDMIISCWSVKLLKMPSVTLTHVCGTNSHNWWAKGVPGVGVVKIFCDSDSSGWKSFRLHDSDSTALVRTLVNITKLQDPVTVHYVFLWASGAPNSRAALGSQHSSYATGLQTSTVAFQGTWSVAAQPVLPNSKCFWYNDAIQRSRWATLLLATKLL